MTFTISKSRWHRGDGSTSLLLRRQDCKSDFAGLICLSLGIPPESLAGVAHVSRIAPDELKATVAPYATWLAETYRANDQPGLSEDQCIAFMQVIAKRHGHQIIFVE